MKILILCPAVPYPLDNGGTIRIFHLVKGLARENQVDLLCMGPDAQDAVDLTELKRRCRRVMLARRSPQSKGRQLPGLAARLLRGAPFYTKYVDHPDFRRRLYQATQDTRYDVVEFVHSHMAVHLRSLYPAHGAKLSLSMQNVACDQYRRMFKRERRPVAKLKLLLTWLPMTRWEPLMVSRFDKVIVVSEADRQRLLSMCPSADAAVIPNGVDTIAYRPYPRAQRKANLLLVGSMDYEPNVDAAFYFHKKIFPLIKERAPQTTLTIVGKNPPAPLLALERDKGVRVQANLPEIASCYREAMVSVVALRSGGGTRLKILEAMAFGTPVVSTPIGCEGLDVRNGEHLLVTDEPERFAEHCVTLLTDGTTWQRLARNARALAEAKYDWEPIARNLHEVYRDLSQS